MRVITRMGAAHENPHGVLRLLSLQYSQAILRQLTSGKEVGV